MEFFWKLSWKKTKGINGHEGDLGSIIHAQGDFEDMWVATWYTRLLSAP